MKNPRWERGYRSHGYWKGSVRLGLVSLGPRHLWDGIYRWSVDGNQRLEGEEITLHKAKRKVELALAQGT